MNFDEQLQIAIRLAVGAVGGLAVGIEREWSGRAQGERPRFAGVRTFLLIGLLGSLSAVFMESNLIAAGAGILTGCILLIVIAYASAAYRGDRESTTEFAGLIVTAAGTLAGTGHLAMASALNVFVALVLMEKTRIHSFVFRIQSEDLSAGLRFAVLALVVLPVLPAGPFGPEPGIHPRELWALVLLFSGLSFAGLLARRAVGERSGYVVAGLLGGIVSSTLVALNFARESRTEPKAGQALALGVIAACTILPLRVIVLTTILNREIGLASIPYLAVAFATGLIFILLARKDGSTDSNWVAPKNPLRLFSAIQMVFAFQIALFIFHRVRQTFGTAGTLVSSALVGLTDVDTLIFMIGKQQSLDSHLAAFALIIGVFANTILKLTLAIVIGKGQFRKTSAIGLALLATSLIVSMALF